MNGMILEAIGKLLALAVASAMIWLTPKIRAWLEARIGLEKTKKLFEQIGKFVEAADQLYKQEDPTGEIRNMYVKEQLTKLGVAITAEINAYIEGAVFEINRK